MGIPGPAFERVEFMSDGIKRRDFLKVVGAGGAGATMFGCSTERVEKLLPYVVPDEEITPGVSTWYTSVCGECPAGCGTWVRTREGRVVKVEGNPAHPISGGALCSRGYSAVQGLYSPDRLASPMVREGEGFRAVGWDEAEALLAQRLQEGGSHRDWRVRNQSKKGRCASRWKAPAIQPTSRSATVFRMLPIPISSH